MDRAAGVSPRLPRLGQMGLHGGEPGGRGGDSGCFPRGHLPRISPLTEQVSCPPWIYTGATLPTVAQKDRKCWTEMSSCSTPGRQWCRQATGREVTGPINTQTHSTSLTTRKIQVKRCKVALVAC